MFVVIWSFMFFHLLFTTRIHTSDQGIQTDHQQFNDNLFIRGLHVFGFEVLSFPKPAYKLFRYEFFYQLP